MKIKKKIDRKSLLSLTSIILAFLVVIVATCFQAGLDISNWWKLSTLSTILVTVGICIFSIIAGYGYGDSYYRTKENGLFQTTIQCYDNKLKEVLIHIEGFDEWNDIYYQRQYYDKIRNYLRNDYGIKQWEDILKLSKEQIRMLTKAQRFFIDENTIYFLALNTEQINAILRVVNGKIKLKKINANYFLNLNAKSKAKTLYELASKESEHKRNKFLGLTIYRIILLIAVGLVFTGLEVGQKEGNGGQIAIDLISRLFTLCSGASWGFFIASEMVKEECIYIDYKTKVLSNYINEIENGIFVPKSIEELAKEKVKEEENKSLEETKEILPNEEMQEQEQEEQQDTENIYGVQIVPLSYKKGE